MRLRIFHPVGPGRIVQAHEDWKRNVPSATEVSITYSSQFEQFCQDIGAEAYIVSWHSDRLFLHDGAVTLEQRPKPLPGARGGMYHLAEIIYGLGLLVTAMRFRANLAVIQSKTMHYWAATLLRLMGVRVVVVMYITLWPHGFPPTRPLHRLLSWMDSLFFRYVATAVLGLSPECTRQVEQITRGHSPRLYQFRAQFIPEFFAQIPPPPPHSQRPFQIMFVGRATRDKGIFDILEMAQKIEAKLPGRVHWEICGGGPDLVELRQRHLEMGLTSVVNIRGWTSPLDQLEVYARSHAAIVPTRSSFNEGLAMTAVEAILAGRPLITNSVVPALDLLRPACVEARADDVDSYCDGVIKLCTDPEYYETLREACPELGKPFYDREEGLTAVLKRVVKPLEDQLT